jgi:hypothetical protein
VKRRLVVLAALAALVAGCSSNNFRDVEGVPSNDPDKIEVFNNVDQHPNLVVVCIHGVAFVTTTREYNAVTRVEKLDRICPGGGAS